MSEYIGKVLINDDDYPGRDLYSDGAVEDELLAIAKNERPEDFDRVVAERKSWPVMYHFSSVRGNILSWYPIKKTDKVLEIGAGCGAVTSVLAERAGSVTCVDLSKKRSLVNAYRNRESENIEIRLGNFQDVEKQLPCDYDLITLIGVFEYGSAYIASEKPYVDFLKIIRRHLAPGGRILIAIENRLGMKYLAGCTEDHTGKFFDGLENYPDTNYVRTFSRPELELIFDEAGFDEREFRYPYPDYKFALSIYSDDYLPKVGELRNNMVNYDRRRIVLFDEAKAFDSLVPAGEFPMFSNSFFVTLGKEPEKRASFVKFSNDRSSCFSIRTDIEADRDYSVVKYPLKPEGGRHIEQMLESAERLGSVFEGTSLAVNRIRQRGNAVSFEFVQGESLEERVDRLLRKPDELIEELKRYFSELDRTAKTEHQSTDAFTEVFGNELPARSRRAPETSDIDLVLNNILVSGDRKTVIDYEWTFPFTVPIDFIKWRVIHYYGEGNPKRRGLDRGELYKAAGLSSTDLPYFTKMEQHFQDYISRDAAPLWKLYPDISDGSVSLGELTGGNAAAGGESIVVYFDRGSGFNENDILRVKIPEGGRVRIEADLLGVKAVRLDPTEHSAAVRVSSLQVNGRAIDRKVLLTNGYTADRERYVFNDDDPQLVIPRLSEDAEKLTAVMEIVSSGKEVRETVGSVLKAKDERIRFLEQRIACSEDTLRRVNAAVEAVKGTKVVRTYRAARRKMKQSDPFEAIRPVLQNHQGIHVSLDRRSYQPEGIYLMGWVYDEVYTGESLEVIDRSGSPIPAEIRRAVRADVKEALSIPDDRMTGFDILIGFDLLEKTPLSLRIENQRGVLMIPLDIEPDPDKRRFQREQICKGESPLISPLSVEYDDWAMDHAEDELELAKQKTAEFQYAPKISIVIPLYRTPAVYLRELMASLVGQTYRNIEICLADGSPDDETGRIVREEYSADSRILYKKLDVNGGISANTNAAIEMSTGEIIMLCDHDDTLEISACYEIVRKFNEDSENDIVYTDEDKVTASGHFLYDPNFKPDFNMDLLCSNNYVCHIFAVKRSTADRAGLFDPSYDGAQDHDFILRCCECARKVGHVPKALYHWRAHPDSTAGDPASKMYAYENGRRSVEAHWKRLGIPAEVSLTDHLGHYRTILPVKGEPLVSILIPNKDQADLLKTAVESIEQKTLYRNFEILILENGSTAAATDELYRRLTSDYDNVRILTWKEGFNYSKINNFGVSRAEGEYILLLNNDVEVKNGEWLGEMLGYCQRSDVGAVGAYLLYPNGTIQHTGVIVGIGGAASHMFGGMDPNEYPGGGRCFSTQDLSAVTAACLMTKKSVYEQVGGLDERYEVAFGDIDFCLKIREAGLLVVENVYAQLIHYESATRGSDRASVNPEKHARFLREAKCLRDSWPVIFEAGDPYYNPNLEPDRPDFSLKGQYAVTGPEE